MDTNSLFRKYHRRLARIGTVKACLVALAAGLAVMAVLALITWFTPLTLGWVLGIIFGGGILAFAATEPIVYRKYFSPTPQKIARLVDKLGLEERAITMYELEHDESYLVFCQREDAKEKLKSVDEKQLRFDLPKAMFLAVAVCCVFAVSLTTVSSLASVGRIGKAYEYIFPEEEEPEQETEYVDVYYIAKENGSIEGEEHQHIEKGGNTKTVKAVPDEGYQFLQWSDGILTPERRDWEVMEDLAVEAIFLQPSESDQGDRESDEGQKGDSPSDDEDKQGSQEDENGDPNENEGDEEEGDQQGGESEDPAEGDEDDGAGEDGEGEGVTGALGQNDNNTVIDGATDYTSEFDYESSKEEIESDPNLPDDLKDVLGDYFDTLRP